MIVRKILLAACAAALMSTPAWALPSQASSKAHERAPSTTPVGPSHTTPVGPPSTTPNDVENPGNGKGRGNGSGPPATHGSSHRCAPHKVAFVVAGTLVSQTLTKNADGSYSGELTIVVKHTNRHAAGEEPSTEKTYTLSGVHVTFGVADANADGSVGTDDLKAGDRVVLLGKITTLARKCDHSGFTPKKTFRQVVFTEPASS